MAEVGRRKLNIIAAQPELFRSRYVASQFANQVFAFKCFLRVQYSFPQLLIRHV